MSIDYEFIVSRFPIGTYSMQLRALRELDKHTTNLSRVQERLSSGARINTASDDPAGLALATRLEADSRIYARGVRNINDGISALSVAEGALQSLTDIASRLSELATQAANGSFTATQRAALDAEAQALVTEYGRISETTTFNGRRLLDGSFDNVRIETGAQNEGAHAIYLDINDIGSASQTSTVGTGSFTSFFTSNNSTTNGHIAMGDVNGDGKLDIISGEVGQYNVSLGNGDGTFLAQSTYYTGAVQEPWTTQLADVDGDGKLDIIGSVSTYGISFLKGNGNGTFEAPRQWAGYYNGYMADINGDGKLDLIAAVALNNNVHVMLGNGDFTFQAPTQINTGNYIYAAYRVADVNGDGDQDIIGMNAFASPANAMFVILGNGNGTFEAPRTYNVAQPGIYQTFALDDVNNDGRKDFVFGDDSGGMYILLGNADGSFSAKQSIGSGIAFHSTALADLNGDGNLDIVGSSSTGNTLRVFFGNGNGTFTADTSYATVSTPGNVLLNDVNGDGVSDIITGSLAAFGGAFHVLTAQTTTSTISSGLSISLLTQDSAREALTTLETFRESLLQERGRIGASMSRLNVAAEMSSAASLVHKEAASKIRDIDVAQEVAEMVRLSILQQSATAMLASMKLSSALVLKLLS